jgi:hypothetical protein
MTQSSFLAIVCGCAAFFSLSAGAFAQVEQVQGTSTLARVASTSSAGRAPSEQQKYALRQSAARAGMSFVPNRGQAPADDLFLARGQGTVVGLQRDGFAIDWMEAAVPKTAGSRPPAADGGMPSKLNPPALQFAGSSADVQVEGLDASSAKVNYFEGRDPSGWKTNLPSFQRVRYKNLYPGIDLVYYGQREGRLEYDLVVAPGADPDQVKIRVTSAGGPGIDRDGNLLLDGARGQASLMRPVFYQDLHNSKQAIAGSFVKLSDGAFGFAHADYDRSRPLIIDPQINMLYATYAGGIHNDEAMDMTLDASGNTYITGYAASTDFPVSSNAYQQSRQNNGTYTYDVVVLKFDSSGNLLFSTFLGGSQNEQGEGIRVSASGLVYVGGYTGSTNFPVTANALQPTAGGGQDAFFAVLSNDGSQLIYSTYLGGAGDENIYRMIEDANGNLWVAGAASAAGLPATTGAYQTSPNGTDNGFVAEFTYTPANAQPLGIDALTFLGGSTNGQEGGLYDIALDATGNVYVGGMTTSVNYPSTANAYSKASTFTLSGGCYNSSSPDSIATVSELTANLKTLVYSTVLGGKTEDQNGYPVCNQFTHTVHPDGNGNIWVAGITGMSDFPTTSKAISTQLNGNGSAGVDLFLTELTPGSNATTLTYSTYLGGSAFDYGDRALWDANNDIWIIATTQSIDWPGIVQGASLQPTNAGGYDIGLLELQPDGTKILYSTYLGGNGDEDATSGRATLAFDGGYNLHLAGATGSNNFPVTSGAFQSSLANGVSYADGYDIYYSVLGTGTIGTIGPVTGGNAGDTTITVDGAGYASGATCSLVLGNTTIVSTAASVNAAGTSISCTFPLSGATSGSYDVVVSNPNGTTFTKQGGFAVQSGGSPNLTVSILGRSVIRTGYPYTFSIDVTNSGSENAYAIPLWITIPTGLTYTVSGLSATESAELGITAGKNIEISVMVPLLMPGQTTSIPLQITSAVDSSALPITATLQAPWFATLAEANAAATSSTYTPGCFPSTVNSYAVNCLGSYIADIGTSSLPLAMDATGKPRDAPTYGTPEPKPIDYVNGQNEGIQDGKGGKEANPGDLNSGTLFHFDGYVFGFNIGTMQAVGTAAGKPGAGPGAGTGGGGGSGNGCTTCPNPPSLTPSSTTTPASSSSADPNFKSGSTGDGSSSRFVRGAPALTYIVGFENEATASLPAAQVVITDPLDATKVNLNTVSLGTITIGSKTITLPSGTSNYNTTYSLSSTLSVRIQGSIDTSSGVLKWTFTSIDPSTGLPPTDPTVGFLPPDTDGIVGQGSVSFAVSPVAALTTGTPITNTASVVFDANAAIVTHTWLNTIDADLPSSKVTALPASFTSTGGATTPIPVNWSGTDKGSGIALYSIYVSDNGGAYTVWQTKVSTTSATYNGQTNHTYGFYSIATDNAGNVEPAKSAAEASTVVAGASTTTALSASPLTANPGTAVTFTATVTPAAATGTVTFLNGAATLGQGTLSGGIASFTTSSLAAGSYSVTAVYGGNTVYAGSTSAAVAETIVAPGFTLSASPSSLAIAAGATGSATITLTPKGGFNQAVALSCSGLPAYTTCSFTPSSLTPNGSAVASTLVLTTNVANARLSEPVQSAKPGRPLLAVFLLGFTTLLGATRLRRASTAIRRCGSLLSLVLLLAALTSGLLAGCGNGTVVSNSAPRGTSTVTISATGGNQTSTALLSVTIQ